MIPPTPPGFIERERRRAVAAKWLKFTKLRGYPAVENWYLFATRDPSLPAVIAAAPDDSLLNPNFCRIAALKPLGLEGGARYLEDLLVEFGGTRKNARTAIAALVLALARSKAPKQEPGIT